MEPNNPGAYSQGSVNLDVTRFEVTAVFTHPNAQVDIILVHGLNGQPKRTWTAKNGLYWPAELLPETLKECPANILVYGYNADVYSRGIDASPSDNFIYHHAMTLVSHLTAFRRDRGTSNNPLIWVAHSLGGILVKRALLYSNDLRDADHEVSRSIYVSTYGIIFLGTPHTGSGLAFWGRVLQGMAAAVPKKFFDTEPVLIKSLKRNNERLQEINNHFLDIYQRFKIQMVHENHKTDLKGTKAFVVDVDSASPQLPGVTYYGIEADHSHMCKFDGPNAPGYRTMVTSIQEWVKEAPLVIDVRWTVEQEDRVARARREIEERRLTASLRARSKSNADADLIEGIPDLFSLRGTTVNAASPTVLSPGGIVESPITSIPLVSDAATSPMPLLPPLVSSGTSDASTIKQDPLFLHPEKFRPNSYFVGRKRELEELHQKLTDSAKRAEGTSAVVIQSLPGGGKTHLARQYVFQHRTDYPGGIYWVRAKSISEMEQFFWTIAKNEALRNVVEKTLVDKPGSSSDSQKELCDPHNIVNIVRAWFSSFDQWLLVFDGIIFNTPEIERFIPDAKNTSIIYTSIQSNVSGRYEFDNPQIMKLDMLSPEDARDLLLTEMERKKPWREDDRTQALDIVNRMGCLPLMVHAAARHIKATREPLSKYLRTLQNRVWASDLPAYYNVWDELKSRGAYPALNLMYILAFLGGRVPVGFLNLGLRALDSRTPVMTRDASHRKRSLNNSLGTLIAFALVDRYEAGSVSPTSSQNSSKQSHERASESVDLLRIHTVVQRFFVDVLTDIKDAHFWLERSANVFCHASDEADRLNGTRLGLLDDYRCFKIHGEMLQEHLSHMEKKSPLPPGVANAKIQIRTRLDACEEAIMKLSEVTQAHIVNETGTHQSKYVGFTIMSVFERANSFSDSSASESANSSSQASADNSGISTRTGTGFDDERAGVHIITTNTAMNMDINTPIDLEAELHLGDIVQGPDGGKGKAPMHQLWTNPPIANASGGTLYQSPDLVFSPVVPGGHDPYSWHVPYPPTHNTIPAPPSPEEDDGTDEAVTEVPTPQIPVTSPAETEIHNPGSLSGFGVLYPDPTTLNHRAVQRNNEHRYRDRAGAWRDKNISDPRSSVSRELAQGFMFMPGHDTSRTESPARNSSVTGSVAKHSLNKLRAWAGQSYPPRSKPESGPASNSATGDEVEDVHQNQNKNRAQSTGTLGVRPLMTLQQNMQGHGIPIRQNIDEESVIAPSDEVISSSNLPKRNSQSPPSSFRNSLKRFKGLKELLSFGSASSGSLAAAQEQKPENVAPHDSQVASPSPNTENALASSIDSLLGSQPGTLFRGSRTARSTPNQGYGPFMPPPYRPSSHYQSNPATTAPQQENIADRSSAEGMNIIAQSDLPASIQQWGSDVYHPGNQRISSSDLSFGFADQDRMAASYPSVDQASRSRQLPQHLQQAPNQYPEQAPFQSQQTQQQLLRPARTVDGYTSQPMSRNTSAQSQPSAYSHVRHQGRLSSIPAASAEPSNYVEEYRPHSRSLPHSVDGRSMPVGAQQIPFLRRNSRSSLVQTEPSPQTANPFADVNTSYRQWEERHQEEHHERPPYLHGPFTVWLEVGEPPVFRPAPATYGAGVIAHSSGSRSGSGSGSGRGVGSGQPGSVPMSRSQSDHGPESVPAAGAWVSRSIPTARMGAPGVALRSPYPPQLTNVDGDDYSSEPMSRSSSGTGNGFAQARGANGNANGGVLGGVSE